MGALACVWWLMWMTHKLLVHWQYSVHVGSTVCTLAVQCARLYTVFVSVVECFPLYACAGLQLCAYVCLKACTLYGPCMQVILRCLDAELWVACALCAW